jgi:hypothetical protein
MNKKYILIHAAIIILAALAMALAGAWAMGWL